MKKNWNAPKVEELNIAETAFYNKGFFGTGWMWFFYNPCNTYKPKGDGGKLPCDELS